MPPKYTLWSLVISPARSEWKPTPPGLHAPRPSRPYSASSSSVVPLSSAIMLPMMTAVPLGASSLSRSCWSMISISVSSTSARAAISTNFSITFTIFEVLHLKMIGMCRPAASNRSNCSGENPVLAVTRAFPCATAKSSVSRHCSTLETSMSASHASMTDERSSATGMPRSRPRPTTWPRSRPM